MALRGVFAGFFGATLLLLGGASMAAGYPPDEFFGLDLSKAVLSPTPLGPPTEFAPVAVQAKGDRTSDDAADVVRAEPRVAPPHRKAATQARGEASKAATRGRLAPRHGNPLDAQAMDTRIQVWPCRSGGICNWKQ